MIEKKKKCHKDILKMYEKVDTFSIKYHDNVIYYIKTVYFFIHVKNENIAFPFFLLFLFFRFYSLFVNYDFFTK